MDKKEVIHNVRSVILVIMSALIYSIAIRVFIDSANLIPAGFIGLSLIVVKIVELITHITIPYIILYL